MANNGDEFFSQPGDGSTGDEFFNEDALLLADTDEGGSPDTAIPDPEFFASDADRAKASLADDKHIAAMLGGPVQRNSEGKLVRQLEDGSWVRDADDFLDNPGNWLLSAMGSAPKNIGMLLGGAMGGAAGAAAGPAAPLAVPAGAIAAAAAGAETGELAKQYLAEKLGLKDPGVDSQAAVDAAKEGALGEVGGQVIGKLAKGVGETLKPYTPRITEWTTGVPRAAVQRLLDRAKEVLNPKSAIDVARQGTEEILAKGAQEGAAIKAAREAYKAEFGNTIHGTGHMIAPEGGTKALSDFERKYLTTPELASEAHPRALESKMQFGAPVEVSPGRPAVKMTPLKEQVTISKPDVQTWFKPDRAYNYPEIPVSSVDRRLVSGGKPVTVAPEVAPVKMSPYEGVLNTMPEAPASRILQGADELGNEINAGFDKMVPGQRPSPELRAMKGQRARMKESLHAQSSPYAEADARFNRFAKDTRLLQSGVKEQGRESFISNLVKGKNKTEQLEALARVAPDTMTNVLDMQAAHAFDNGSDKLIGNLTKRHLLQAGLGGLGAGATHYATGDDESAAIVGAMLMAGSSPWLAKQMIGRVLPRAPRLLEIPAALATANSGPWHLMEKKKDE